MGGDLNAWWRIGVPLAVGLERLLFRVRVSGIHRVPLDGPAILAFNHVSVLDGPCLAIETAWRRRRVTRFLVAAEMFRHPVNGWFLRTYRQIPIHRGAGDARALDDALTTIRGGAIVAIAPEGAVNPAPGELQRVRTGVARLALPTGAPVIPVGIWGTHRRWPKAGPRWSRPLRPRLGISFGAAIEPVGEVVRQDDVEGFADAVRRRLEEQLADARALAADP